MVIRMIKREKYINQIRNFYDSDLVKVLVGIRRCGKSVILQSIMEELKEKTDNIIYLNFEKTNAGFKVILTCDDPTSSLSRVYVIDNNGNQIILLKDINCYSTEYTVSTDGNYTFSILYYYKVSSIKVESKTYDQTFNYQYIVNDVTSNPSTPPTGNNKNCNSASIITLSNLFWNIFPRQWPAPASGRRGRRRDLPHR